MKAIGLYKPLTLIIWTTLSVVQMGCGNYMYDRTAVRKIASNSFASSNYANTPINTNTVTSTVDATMVCPSFENILPDYDYAANGTDRYTVCRKQDNASQIQIFGIPSLGNQICVFPAARVDSTHVYPKPDTSTATNLPLAKCGQASASVGLSLDFTSDKIDFNSVFIVAESDKDQMQRCLALGDYYSCPRYYSFGTFR